MISESNELHNSTIPVARSAVLASPCTSVASSSSTLVVTTKCIADLFVRWHPVLWIAAFYCKWWRLCGRLMHSAHSSAFPYITTYGNWILRLFVPSSPLLSRIIADWLWFYGSLTWRKRRSICSDTALGTRAATRPPSSHSFDHHSHTAHWSFGRCL